MPKIETVAQFIHRSSQIIIVALLGVVIYFVKDIHAEIKETHALVIKHETALQVQDGKINFLTFRVDALGKKCFKE